MSRSLPGRARVGVPLVVAFGVFAIAGPWLAPYPPLALDLAHDMEPPSRGHWLGTADNGVDVLSVLLAGARVAATVAIPVVLLTLAIGTLVGMLAGWWGRGVDLVLTRFTDAVQAMPGIVLTVALLAFVARPGVAHMVVALVITGWVPYARVARAETLRLRDREFVTAALALGASTGSVLLRHVLPNAAGPLVVQATFGLGGAVLAEASLSFLGLGPPGMASWGALLDQGTAYLLRAPRIAMSAGTVLGMTVVGFNLTGDWLRDWLDPRGK